MSQPRVPFSRCFVASVILLGACTTGSGSGGTGTGGTTGSGGTGVGNGSGGSTSSGGATGSGGATSTGGAGAPGTGGATSTGGTVATGTGGRAGTGGSVATGTGGRTSAGGAGGRGGTIGAGGAVTTGSGGVTGMGGAIGSAACGMGTFPAGEQTYMLDVAGTSRSYIVGLPTGYDGSRPHALVFVFHGRTGTAAQIAGRGTTGYNGVRARMTDAIFVAPQGLGTATDATDTGWPNTGGQDIAFVRAMLDWFNANYCIDQTRIFSTGFSYGGIMSHTIGCQMSDTFRAVAPIAGAIFGRPTCLTHPIAAWMTHGTMDTSAAGGVDFSAGEAARDRIIALNHCQATTMTVGPSTSMCVSYDGCDPGYPVNWCPHDGAHMIPSFAAEGIATFFLQF